MTNNDNDTTREAERLAAQAEKVSEMLEGAAGVYALFESYMTAGFKRSEALALIQAMVSGMAQGQSGK